MLLQFKKDISKLKKFASLKIGSISNDIIIIDPTFIGSGDFTNQIKFLFSSKINKRYICKFKIKIWIFKNFK